MIGTILCYVLMILVLATSGWIIVHSLYPDEPQREGYLWHRKVVAAP